MSIIVKGAEMPETCLDCPLADIEQGWCDNDMVTIIYCNKPPVECPIGALPEKHGDLIDRNALFREMEKASWYNNADRDEVAEELVLNAPTIVDEES